MTFRSKDRMQLENHLREEEMLRYISYMIYETQLNIDEMTDSFIDRYGEEHREFVDEVLDSTYC